MVEDQSCLQVIGGLLTRVRTRLRCPLMISRKNGGKLKVLWSRLAGRFITNLLERNRCEWRSLHLGWTVYSQAQGQGLGFKPTSLDSLVYVSGWHTPNPAHPLGLSVALLCLVGECKSGRLLSKLLCQSWSLLPGLPCLSKWSMQAHWKLDSGQLLKSPLSKQPLNLGMTFQSGRIWKKYLFCNTSLLSFH